MDHRPKYKTNKQTKAIKYQKITQEKTYMTWGMLMTLRYNTKSTVYERND